MKALQINKLREWSDDSSLGKYIQVLHAFSRGSTFLPCLAAAPSKDCLGVLELSLNQTCLPAPGDSLRQDGACRRKGRFLCCLAWPLPGLGLARLCLQDWGVWETTEPPGADLVSRRSLPSSLYLLNPEQLLDLPELGEAAGHP